MSQCEIEGCNKPIRAIGLCSAHYFQSRRQQGKVKSEAKPIDLDDYWEWVKKELNL